MPDLRPYQIEDVKFLSNLDASACFNEQRTGKTPTALNVIKEKGLKKVAIIVPSSAIFPWRDEYERWLNLPCIAMVGTPKQREKLMETWTHGLVIGYDTFKMSKTAKGMIQEIAQGKPEMVIIDEAHRIKNRGSARAQAVIALSNVKHKLALTGTPAPGKPHEVYNILHFLYPQDFPAYWPFIEKYFSKQKQSARGRTFWVEGPPNPHTTPELQMFLSKISTQRKRKEVMPWLPQKEKPTPIRLPATPAQTRYLKELSKNWETEHVITQGVLDRLIRYRQICLDPELLDLKGSSPKTDWIRQYLVDYPDEPILIFSKFTSYLIKLNDILQKDNIKTGLMIGDTKPAERAALVQEFQTRKLQVLLLNIEVGKEALTLDTAETIIFTDKYPPIGDIEQAEDRFVATTQDKASKANKIFELMIKDSYDEQIYELLQRRSTEVEIFNDYKKYLKGVNYVNPNKPNISV